LVLTSIFSYLARSKTFVIIATKIPPLKKYHFEKNYPKKLFVVFVFIVYYGFAQTIATKPYMFIIATE
jgi:hypothetical protein